MSARMALTAAGLCMTLVAACGSSASPSPSAQPVASAVASAAASGLAFDTAAAEKYCTDQGGMLVDRQATANTNGDPAQYFPLAGKMRLCEFEEGTGAAPTRISVDLVTLYSEQPTLAGLAYLSKLMPPKTPTPSTNPAAYNCTTGLGGTRNFGNALASGGGWVDQSQKTFVVMNLCVFADMSAIDEWGIFYYTDGTVRGADLAKKMRYQPNGALPPVFTPQK